jgi:hypothetical protein
MDSGELIRTSDPNNVASSGARASARAPTASKKRCLGTASRDIPQIFLGRKVYISLHDCVFFAGGGCAMFQFLTGFPIFKQKFNLICLIGDLHMDQIVHSNHLKQDGTVDSRVSSISTDVAMLF